MDFAALPGIMSRVSPVYWPALIVNLWAITLWLWAQGITERVTLLVWPDGRVAFDKIAEHEAADLGSRLHSALAYHSRFQQTAACALLSGQSARGAFRAEHAGGVADQAPPSVGRDSIAVVRSPGSTGRLRQIDRLIQRRCRPRGRWPCGPPVCPLRDRALPVQGAQSPGIGA